MKYCYQCGRLTSGDPLFCNFCGRSYDLKLCPRHHPNPRIAEVCSQCGSRELSTPQPRVSVWWHFFEFLVRVALGALLVSASLAILAEVLREMLASPQLQSGLLGLGMLLGILWWLWSKLPQWFRQAIRHALKRREGGNGH
jgi:RNA polymerase subunit RPABC4/transcription elongation factor Spt4